MVTKLDAMRNAPPDFFDEYKVKVVREKNCREEWGAV